MGWLKNLLEAPQRAEAYANQVEILQESFNDLSLQLEDRGWKSILEQQEGFSRSALLTSARDGRVLAVAHPLVRRGLSLRASYIHGRGVQLAVEGDETGDVNSIVQAWWDDPSNQAALTGMEARTRLERALSTDGNLFIVQFVNPLNGFVKSRTIPFEEITEIITNPDDRTEAWFYLREVARDGGTVKELYPDINYTPSIKQRSRDGVRIFWNRPIRHVKVNDVEGWLYGVGDTYSIAPWARAYRDFLSDWAKLMRALSQFAWKQKTPAKHHAKVAGQLNALAPNLPGQPGTVGATAVMTPDMNLEAIPKSGATIDSDSGRPLLAMIAAGLDVPVTMLSTDPGVTGSRATAETLDEPMYLAMEARRAVWTSVYRDIATFAIERAILAPQGGLNGRIEVDPWSKTDQIILGDGVTPNVLVEWPELSTTSLKDKIDSIVTADGTGKIPPAVIARELLTALNIDNIDEVMSELVDDEGNWQDPYKTVGDTLAAAFKHEGDPTDLLSQAARFS